MKLWAAVAIATACACFHVVEWSPVRETIITPIGLMTEPNKLGVYPNGAMARADNVIMRSPGLVQAMPAASAYVAAFGGTSSEVRRFFDTGAQVIAWTYSGSSWLVYWLSGVATDMTFADTVLGIPSFATDGRLDALLYRGRTLFNTDFGIFVTDYTNPATTAQRMARHAGMVQPIMYDFVVTTPGTTLAANDVVTYAATIERTFADGYVAISEPSPFVRVKCPAASVTGGVNFKIRFGGASATVAGRGGVLAGDVIKIYRSPPVPSVGLNLNTEAGTTVYLAKTYVVTSADVTLQRTGAIGDNAPSQALTDELYTNPGQGGLNGARRRPPHAKTLAAFQGYSFYGNVITPAQWLARFPSGLGALGNDYRAIGIGTRGVTGSFTSGSTDVTGVSAADLIGLQVGQRVIDGGVPPAGWIGLGWMPSNIVGMTIAALPPTTPAGVVRLSGTSNATITAGAGGAFASVDVVELDGKTYPLGDVQMFLDALGAGTTTPFPFYAMTTTQTIAYREFQGSPATGVFKQGFALEPYRFVQGSLSVRGTNGQNYDPPIPLLTQTAQTFTPTPQKNFAYWSWDQQPEAVAPGNYTPIGEGEIYRVLRAGNALWFFCSDGLYKLTGYGTRSSGLEAQWQVESIDASLILAGPNAATVLRDSVYAYTNRGFVEILNGGVVELTNGILADVLPGQRWAADSRIFVERDEANDEVWLGVRGSLTVAAPNSQLYVYNVLNKAFTKLVQPTTAAIVFASYLETMMFGRAAIGSQPSAWRFNETVAGWEAPTVDFQQIYGNDPMLSKQWIDMTLVFSTHTGVDPAPRFNGVAGATRARTTQNTDARVTFGVPRTAPAVGNTLAPGLQMAATTVAQMTLRALSLRWEPFSEQQVYR
jgi:hypothetical protein